MAGNKEICCDLCIRGCTIDYNRCSLCNVLCNRAWDTVEPDLIATVENSDGKLSLSLKFTVKIMPIKPYTGVVFSFRGSLSSDRYHFYFLMIWKIALTFLSLSNSVLQCLKLILCFHLMNCRTGFICELISCTNFAEILFMFHVTTAYSVNATEEYLRVGFVQIIEKSLIVKTYTIAITCIQYYRKVISHDNVAMLIDWVLVTLRHGGALPWHSFTKGFTVFRLYLSLWL